MAKPANSYVEHLLRGLEGQIEFLESLSDGSLPLTDEQWHRYERLSCRLHLAICAYSRQHNLGSRLCDEIPQTCLTYQAMTQHRRSI